jgi:D-glycero-alpha-D-manno-heptose 1-phosphate guanylyltransferase
MSRKISTRRAQTSGAMLELTDVTVAIIAGGLGTRLHTVVTDRPKALADIGGRPFLTYLFDQLAMAGARNIVLCTGYLGDQIRTIFGESHGLLRLIYSQESVPLGTAGALRLALPLLKSNPVLVMNGDSYCEANLKEFCRWHSRRRANATLLLTKVPDPRRFGRVRVAANGTVNDFEEKGSGNGPGWINAGVYLLNRDLLAEIPADRAMSLEREVFPAWLGRGLYGFRSEGRFVDIGIPEAYADAQSFFATDLRR